MPIAPVPMHERALELARAGARRSRARGGSPRSQIDAGSTSTPSRPSERGIADQLRRILGHELAREPVQARDPALAVVARQARVGGTLAAGEAVRARAAHDRRDEVAAGESVAVALDPAEELVAEHEQLVALGRYAEQPLGDLPVGTADADLERPHRAPRPLARAARARSATRAVCASPGWTTSAEHQAAVRPPSMTSTVPVTNAARQTQVLDRLGDLVGRARAAPSAAGRAARRATRRPPRRGAVPTASRRCRGRRR